METIPLQAIPNQSLTFVNNNIRYALSIKETSGTMAASISINDVEIISGIEINTGTPLIPYRYLENGNFIFVTQDDAIPYYNQFGLTQRLVFIPQSELDAAR